MIGRMLHIANSWPPHRDDERERFYSMKTQILRLHGRKDGIDVQFFEGKKCWSCDGRGYWLHTWSGDYGGDCMRCWNGWFKRPTWVMLQRWHIGQFRFHQPIERVHRIPDWAKSTSRPVINDFIEHRNYRRMQVLNATIWLGLRFDREVAVDARKSLRWYWPRHLPTTAPAEAFAVNSLAEVPF